MAISAICQQTQGEELAVMIVLMAIGAFFMFKRRVNIRFMTGDTGNADMLVF
jgi:hypothetical protein